MKISECGYAIISMMVTKVQYQLGPGNGLEDLGIVERKIDPHETYKWECEALLATHCWHHRGDRTGDSVSNETACLCCAG